MQPHSPHKTPQKQSSTPNMQFIRTPQVQKEEDLYEILIKASPPKILFPYANDHSSNEINQASQSLYQSEEYSEASQNVEAKKQELSEAQKNRQAVQFHHVTPQKPKRISKGCHCQKSKCQKKYCDCYKVGQVCGENCACIGCENQHMTANHRKLQKMVQMTRSGKGGKQLRCNCKNSHCLKNYCECHSAGRMCSDSCNCIQCDNKMDSDRGYEGHKRRHLSHIAEWNSNSSAKENILFN